MVMVVVDVSQFNGLARDDNSDRFNILPLIAIYYENFKATSMKQAKCYLIQPHSAFITSVNHFACSHLNASLDVNNLNKGHPTILISFYLFPTHSSITIK